MQLQLTLALFARTRLSKPDASHPWPERTSDFSLLDVTRTTEQPDDGPHTASHPFSTRARSLADYALPISGNAHHPPETLAALVLLSPAEPELSLSPHQLEVAPSPQPLPEDDDLIQPDDSGTVVPEAAPGPVMMAPLPHQATDKRRVKVYELRHNDWFDRGTGFCYGCFVSVCQHPGCLRLHMPLLPIVPR